MLTFVPSVVEEFCKRVYEDDDHFIFFKPFCNLYYSVYADALLLYQRCRIDYDTFCQEFQELSWMDGKRTPLDGKRLKMYIMSMREVVEAYKKLTCWTVKELKQANALAISEFRYIFASDDEPRNRRWLWVGCSFRQFIAEQRIENGVQIVELLFLNWISVSYLWTKKKLVTL